LYIHTFLKSASEVSNKLHEASVIELRHHATPVIVLNKRPLVVKLTHCAFNYILL